jgi:hypothetical protein
VTALLVGPLRSKAFSTQLQSAQIGVIYRIGGALAGLDIAHRR